MDIETEVENEIGILTEQWNLFLDYILNPELWVVIARGAVKIILIIIIAGIIVKVGRRVLHRMFTRRDKGPFRISERRENTLKKLVQNTLSYVVYFTAFMMILDTLTIPIGALLAGAGVAGLAIGFGTQNLVRDIVTGFFIIFEDQFSVGDFVKVSGVEGTVEEIGLRTTKVLSWTGELHVIPNGKIDQVVNYSLHNSITVVDVSIPYEVDIPRAEKAIVKLLDEMILQYPQLVNVPELLGVEKLDSSHVVLRVIAEVHPMEHWEMARILKREIKGRLEREGIDIPFPRMVIYRRNEEESRGVSHV